MRERVRQSDTNKLSIKQDWTRPFSRTSMVQVDIEEFLEIENLEKL